MVKVVLLVALVLVLEVAGKEYNHMVKKHYKIALTNGYEDGTVGVHLKNKKQQVMPGNRIRSKSSSRSSRSR